MKILIAIGVRREREAGAASVVLNHAKELEKKGHSVDCWFLEDISSGPRRLKRFEAFFFAVNVARRILQARDRYDVVNLHAPWGCAYGFLRRIAGGSQSPVYVFTLQGSEERYAHMMFLENRKGRASHFKLHNRVWHRLYHRTMYDASIRTADYGLVANREGWICAELKHNLEPGRVRFVPNGVADRFFMTREYQRNAHRLLYAGTWLDRKGVYYLAEAFPMIAARIPSVSLTVAGCGCAESVVRDCFPKEVRERVRVIEFIPRESMPDVYANHDVFVFPSLVEGMPLTLLEAMAAGMPVVTTNTSGMNDVVEHNFNGLLVPPADSNELAAATLRVCGDPHLRCQLGHEAQNTARRYRWERVCDQLEEVLLLAALGARN